jgi:hypothetical protein
VDQTLASWLDAGMSRAARLEEAATSAEYERIRLLDDSVAWAAAQRGTGGPGASAVPCAELRPRRISARLRLAVRDRRHPDNPGRAA